MALPPARPFHRWWLFGDGALIGLAAAFLAPTTSGCVEPGSLAHALGLREGDQLESIDGMIIHDLDSALQAYVRLGDATDLDVRVKRGSQWLDFTYTFVR